jgi:hypothetical protein
MALLGMNGSEGMRFEVWGLRSILGYARAPEDITKVREVNVLTTINSEFLQPPQDIKTNNIFFLIAFKWRSTWQVFRLTNEGDHVDTWDSFLISLLSNKLRIHCVGWRPSLGVGPVDFSSPIRKGHVIVTDMAGFFSKHLVAGDVLTY